MIRSTGIPIALIMAAFAAPAFADNVAVSISVGQPGYYGHIDIGNYPQPQVIYARPVIIEAAPMGVARPPVYLRVPASQAKNWRKHCRKYDACGQPVYFVSDNWYNRVYAPDYRKRHGPGNGHGQGYGQGNSGNNGNNGNGGKPYKHN